MSLQVSMTGSGSIGGVLPGWKIVEEATPAVPGDTRGSFGSATFSAWAKSDSQFLMDNEILLETSNGAFRGRVTDVSVGKRADVSVAGPGQFLNVDKVMPPIWLDKTLDVTFARYGSGTGAIGLVTGLAVDPVDGGILIASVGTIDGADRNRIIKYDSAGNFVTEFASSGTGNGQFFTFGVQIAVSPVDQSVWLGDRYSHRIQKFTTADGGLTYSWSLSSGSLGTGNGQFGSSSSTSLPLAVDSSGNVYVLDEANSRIQKFNSSGTYVAKVSAGSTYAATLAGGTQGFVASIGIASTSEIVVGYRHFDKRSSEKIEIYNSSLTLLSTVNLPDPRLTNTTNATSIIAIGVDGSGNRWLQWGSENAFIQYDSSWNIVRRVFGARGAVAVSSAGMFGFYEPGITSTRNVRGLAFSAITLSSAIERYMEECDSTLNGWTLDYQAAEDPEVVFPGWSGNVWANTKQLLAIYGLHLGCDSDAEAFVVRDIGSETLSIENRSPVVTTPANLTGGQVVDVIYQQPTAGGGIIWDAAIENVRPTIDVAETSTSVLYTVNHPAEVVQVVPTDSLPIQPGRYYVVDSTGTHVPAETWLASGATINLEVGDSPGTVSMTIIGPSAAISGYTGPFYFATGTTAATGTPALSIVGNGTFCDPKRFVRAGSQGNPFNSPFMDTLDRAIQRGHMPSMQDPNVTIQFTCPVSELPEVGQAAGCLVPYEQSIYRIIRVERGNLTATVTAERYVTIEDIDDAWSGETIGDFDDYWDGYSLGDVQVQPLRHD